MYITPEEIYNSTNGGLDIIQYLYPDANEKKKFKLRTSEKTASCSIKKTKDNIWILTDFGGDGKGHNAIELFMLEENVEFKEAVNRIAAKFNITGNNSMPVIPESKPIFETRAATAKEKEKEYSFRTKDFTTEELQELGKYVNVETCKKFHLHSLQSYTYIKDRKALTFTSTPGYPIFLWDHETWKKLYKPRETKKEFRFLIVGEKPQDYIFGLEFIEKEFKKNKKNESEKTDYETDNKEAVPVEDKEDNVKLDSVFLCSGERDALNLASLGKRIICLNSETAHLSIEKYKYIQGMCKTLYNIPDIDDTGKEMGKRFALQFLKAKTILLPEELKNKKDFRGNPCKDLTDFFRHYELDKFDKLITASLPLMFWLELPQFDMKGNPKGIKFEINNVTLYEFLNANGYYRYESKNEECGYAYINVKNHTVKNINVKETQEIREFVNRYMKDLHFGVPLRNMVYKTTQLREGSLANIEKQIFDFKDYDKDFQYIFFKNKTWKITKKGIEEYKPDDVNVYVWSDEVIDFNVNKLEAPFKITKATDGKFNIEIFDKEFIFMKFLANTSRIYWKKADEEGLPLTEEESYEETLHLINKIYCLGYMLHRYKNPSRPWAPFALDARETMLGESNGGTGKSIYMKAPTYFMKHITLNGRDRKLTEDRHIFANVDENTDYILIDDADRYFQLHYFLAPLTGNMIVNPKHNKPYEIPFENSPKIGISSNHTPSNLDASVERRLLYVAFSDYYHKKDNKAYYKKEWSPHDEFGKNIYDDFTDEERNKFYNFIATCIKVYLNFDKIDPPMNNIIRRNLRTEMGENFLDWATEYFDDKYNLNRYIERSTMFNEYQATFNDKYMNKQKFKKKLHAFCNYKEVVFNPDELITDRTNLRILRKNDNNKQTEFFYIQEPGVKLFKDAVPEFKPTQKEMFKEEETAPY